MQPAPLIGNGDVPAGVTKSDGGGDVQSPVTAALAPARRRSGRGGRRPVSERIDEAADEQVDLNGVAGERRVARSGQFDQLGLVAQRPGQAGAGLGTDDGVCAALDDQAGAADPGDQRRHIALRVPDRGTPGVGERRSRGLECPADAVLGGLGRMRLGEHLGEEELQESLVVARPVVSVVLGPALAGAEPVLKPSQIGKPGRRERRQRCRRADEDLARYPLRAEHGHIQRVRRSEGEGDNHRAVGAGGIHDGQRVGRELRRHVAVHPPQAGLTCRSRARRR